MYTKNKFNIIQSLNNEKIKQFLKLSRQKKYRNSSGLFVLEGFRLIYDALSFKVKFKSIFLTEKAFKNFEYVNHEYDSKLLISQTINLVTDSVATKISSVKNSQNIFAVAEKNFGLNLENIQPNDKVLALFEISDPGNLGTLLRSAAAFNFNKVILADCCDLCNPKVIRSSMSSIFKLKVLECTSSVALAWLKKGLLPSWAATLSEDAENVLTLKPSTGLVLLIGNEACGLRLPVLKICDHKIKINMHNKIESLNAAVAGSILMFYFS